MKTKLPIYLDNHATTCLDPQVLDAMLPTFTEQYGNASSQNHVFGWNAGFAVEKARRQIADCIGATESEIIFTSGATESNNLALLGSAKSSLNAGKHIISQKTEHKAILDTLTELERLGFAITLLPVDRYGKISLTELEAAIRPDTFLISIMSANNEIGTIQPIDAIGRLAKKNKILFHTDAAQALGKIPLDVNENNIDLLSMSGHKIYGPKGIGALYIRRKNPHVDLKPILFGGGQERGLRPGTLNVSGIVGLGQACELCKINFLEETTRIKKLRDALHEGLKKLEPISLNGHPTERLCNNLNIAFHGLLGESLVAALSDIAVSSTSACSSGSPSHVLESIGLSIDLVRSSIRFGLGRFTTEGEIEYTINKVSAVVRKLREKR